MVVFVCTSQERLRTNWPTQCVTTRAIRQGLPTRRSTCVAILWRLGLAPYQREAGESQAIHQFLAGSIGGEALGPIETRRFDWNWNPSVMRGPSKPKRSLALSAPPLRRQLSSVVAFVPRGADGGLSCARVATTARSTAARIPHAWCFPAAVCTSLNHVVCHGIPSGRAVLKDGDIIARLPNHDCRRGSPPHDLRGVEFLGHTRWEHEAPCRGCAHSVAVSISTGLHTVDIVAYPIVA